MKRVSVFVLCAALLLAAAAGFGLGRLTAPTPDPGQTFYAAILEAEEGRLLVQGLEVNDLNHRGQFRLAVEQETTLLWRGKALTAAELKPGHNIAITYTGPVLETDPAGLKGVTRILLLDDQP